MIEHLNLAPAGCFYKRKRRLSASSINRLFRALRLNAGAPSKNLFSVNRADIQHSTYSAICFSFERLPSFLDSEAGVADRVFGYLLIVERRDLVAIFKSGLDFPSAFKSDHLQNIGGDLVERAIARHDAVFQKLRLRNMSTSRLALRSKTLEARDLENSVPTSSASRFVPQGYSVLRDDGSYSATPSTGRISLRADRTGFEEIVHWAGEIIDLLLLEGGETSAFIRNFARPLELATMPNDVKPTCVAIDISSLEDRLSGGEDRAIRLVRNDRAGFVEMARVEIDALKEGLDRSFPVENDRAGNHILNPDDRYRVGEVRMGKTRISLLGFSPLSIEGIFVEDATLPVGTDPDRRPLGRYLDREDLFTVLFSSITLAYIDGSLYRDEALGGGGTNFLRHLRVIESLAQATSEKGDFADGQDEFDDSSVFRTIVDEIATDADVLLCDDLGDEWADFIGVHSTTGSATVSFYHAKHGRRSLSASAFHDSVGQAIKNLGHMALQAEAMPAKYQLWEQFYRGDRAVTAIPRILRGGGRLEVDRTLQEVRRAPDILKRVYIVTSSLSRVQVEQLVCGC